MRQRPRQRLEPEQPVTTFNMDHKQKANLQMKRIVLLSIAAIGAVIMAQNVPPAPAPVPSRQNFEKRAKRMSPEEVMKRVGGFLTPPYNGSYCYIVDAQSRVGDDAFDWVVGQLHQVLGLPFRKEKRAAFDAGQTNGLEKAGAVISIVDVPNQPSLLIAPEDGWAQVNMAALVKDSPSPEVLGVRAKKELWRAFIILFGGGNSRFHDDLMRPVTSLKDLDSSPNLVSSPEPFNAVTEGARARGITPLYRATYKRACKEGWAPAPTNDYQKAVWEQVKADKERGPTNPITIPPPKK